MPRAFIAQEAIHSREHACLNAHLDRSHYPVDWIEGSVRRRLAFLRKLGPMRMLGVTIALEHFTAMLADLFDSDPQLWAGTPEEILRMWRWHAMEETEHKAVAFDVFQQATREWSTLRRHLFRAHIMALTSIHFTLDVIRFAAALLEADGTGRWRARWRVVAVPVRRAGDFPQTRAPLSRLVSPGVPPVGLRQPREAGSVAAAVRLSRCAQFGSFTSNLIAASCSGAMPILRRNGSQTRSAWRDDAETGRPTGRPP